MKLLVAVKRVIDYNVKPRVKMDGSGVDLANVKMSMNPFDEIAVEEAIRLKEKGVRPSRGGLDRSRQGAGNAPHRACNGRRPRDPRDQRNRCRAARRCQDLESIAEEEQPGLVILGKQAIDDDSNQVGQMLAALLGWPQGTFASAVEVAGDSVNVTREVDGGLETLKLVTPAIVTTDLRLNEPRYASLPNIMKAKSKPLANKTAADFGVDIAPRLQTLKVVEPGKRQAGSRSHRLMNWSRGSRVWELRNEDAGFGRT
jgi:electron transfer flavoprotein beta subunit